MGTSSRANVSCNKLLVVYSAIYLFKRFWPCPVKGNFNWCFIVHNPLSVSLSACLSVSLSDSFSPKSMLSNKSEETHQLPSSGPGRGGKESKSPRHWAELRWAWGEGGEAPTHMLFASFFPFSTQSYETPLSHGGVRVRVRVRLLFHVALVSSMA